MVKVIFIRHGDKLTKKDTYAIFPRYDPPLTLKSKIKGTSILSDVVEKYGNPSFIISSPYKRTRMTSDLLSNVTGKDCKVDVRISQPMYKNIKCKNKDIDDETLSYGTPISENHNDIITRCYEFMESLKKYDGLVYVVTHNSIINVMMELNYNYTESSLKCFGVTVFDI